VLTSEPAAPAGDNGDPAVQPMYGAHAWETYTHPSREGEWRGS
jgi:hypothetical protein